MPLQNQAVLESRRRLRRRWSGVSAPGSALEGPPGARRPRARRAQIRLARTSQIDAAHRCLARPRTFAHGPGQQQSSPAGQPQAGELATGDDTSLEAATRSCSKGVVGSNLAIFLKRRQRTNCLLLSLRQPTVRPNALCPGRPGQLLRTQQRRRPVARPSHASLDHRPSLLGQRALIHHQVCLERRAL